MNANVFLLLNVTLAFYCVGIIWAHEVAIFRSWRLIDGEAFRRVQSVHWRKLPYWVFGPVALALVGSITLVWYHPLRSPRWAIWGTLGFQLASHVATAAFWGPLQARLSKDSRGSSSPYLATILSTHWIRTFLINAYGLVLLAWAIYALG
jgi:hypothetical protein